MFIEFHTYQFNKTELCRFGIGRTYLINAIIKTTFYLCIMGDIIDTMISLPQIV